MYCPICKKRMNAQFCGGCGFRGKPLSSAFNPTSVLGRVSEGQLLDLNGDEVRSKLAGIPVGTPVKVTIEPQ